MTATLGDVTARKNRPEPSAEEQAAAELVRLAKEQGLSLTGPDGLLKQLTKTVLTEASGHVGIEPRGDDLEDPPEASSAVVKRPGS
jgi:putative transposase